MVDQKSIVLVPFSDLTESKVRPALIVSNPKFNKGEDVIICALTSSIKDRPFSVKISSKNTIARKLKDESQVRADTITRISQSLIIKEIDILDDETFRKVFDEIIETISPDE
jgi:mRNA interferase MazF